MRTETYITYDLKTYINPDTIDKLMVLAYSIEMNHLTKYFLRTIDSKLVDPNKFSLYELRKGGVDFVPVNSDIYQKYLNIINDNSRVSLNSLERLIA